MPEPADALGRARITEGAAVAHVMTLRDPVVVRTLHTAVACGIPPATALRLVLDLAPHSSVTDARRLIEDVTPVLRRLEEQRPRLPASLDTLEPEFRIPAEIASVRAELRDHELRGRLVFGDLVGQRSFFQVAAWAVGGVELSSRDARLLEQLGVNTQLADVRIWPLAIARRAAARNGMMAGILAGLTVALNPNMGPKPVGGFMDVLDRLDGGVLAGVDLETQLEGALAGRERWPGIGRPALGHDERNAQVLQLVREHGKEDGRSWKLALAIDEFFHRRKGIHINSAGLQGAIMRDMGFTPAAATAMCVLYFIVPILAHAVVAEERLYRKTTGHGRAA